MNLCRRPLLSFYWLCPWLELRRRKLQLGFDPKYIQFKPEGMGVTICFSPQFMRKKQKPTQTPGTFQWFLVGNLNLGLLIAQLEFAGTTGFYSHPFWKGEGVPWGPLPGSRRISVRSPAALYLLYSEQADCLPYLSNSVHNQNVI